MRLCSVVVLSISGFVTACSRCEFDEFTVQESSGLESLARDYRAETNAVRRAEILENIRSTVSAASEIRRIRVEDASYILKFPVERWTPYLTFLRFKEEDGFGFEIELRRDGTIKTLFIREGVYE